MILTNADTICAISTPAGTGGIGIVRISGTQAKTILTAMWHGRISTDKMTARKLYLGNIHRPDGSLLDSVMAVFMPGPHTYTGQDMVEFSCHGSPIILGRILETCMHHGARSAAPGEFTRRAFLSGKIDLAQAEAVADLIHANSDQAAKHAASQLSGRLSKHLSEHTHNIMHLRAFVEATIDFPEEDIEFIESDRIAKQLIPIIQNLKSLSNTFDHGRRICEGTHITIIGKPNAGKSSLLNALSGHDIAIVHDIPGTTRDIVQTNIILDDMCVILSDTAGLRDTGDSVEQIGIDRAYQSTKQADIIILVHDGMHAPDCFSHNFDLPSSTPVLTICNKMDMMDDAHVNALMHDYPNICFCSAKLELGLDKVVGQLIDLAKREVHLHEGMMITKLRHKEALDKSVLALNHAHQAISEQLPTECIAEHLRQAQDHLGEITGAITNEDVLNLIFSQFCIGK